MPLAVWKDLISHEELFSLMNALLQKTEVLIFVGGREAIYCNMLNNNTSATNAT